MGWNRQHYNQFGKPKRQYFTAKDARLRRDEFHRENGWLMQVYKCDTCHAFHVGNKEYYKLILKEKRFNEMLVGKLVRALRLVLDKA